MSARVVFTWLSSGVDVRDQFYFSSPEKFGGGAAVGDQVTIISAVTHMVVAVGEIIEEGSPYAECRTVRVTQKFDQAGDGLRSGGSGRVRGNCAGLAGEVKA